ncbi:MAG: nicotinate (nicotinamide) nucleotide adenylyltransferase [Dysgonamonadaceae bacterium]
MDKKQIGIFSGSFNPIHVGHLILANYMAEFTTLDEVWLLVSPYNPLKEKDDLLDEKTRLKMTEIALEDYDYLNASDFEFNLPRPSYTINTLDKLSTDFPDCIFTLIIGGDSWLDFHRWKDFDRLRREYNIIIYPRLGEDVVIPSEFSQNVKLVNAPVMDISSTFIRECIKEGKNMRAFVPSRVYDFIEENKLYC